MTFPLSIYEQELEDKFERSVVIFAPKIKNMDMIYKLNIVFK